MNKVIFVIEQGGGEEYGKDFPNFCVDYLMSYYHMCVCRVGKVSQKLKLSTCSMYLVLINRHFLLSSFR